MNREIRLGSFLLLMISCSSTYGVIIRHDRDDADYIALGNLYECVGFVHETSNDDSFYFGSGVLISPQWVLTAAHVAQDGVEEVVFAPSWFDRNDTNTYSATGIILYPEYYTGQDGWDIALVRLSSPVSGITPATLYTGSDERGHIAHWTGFGITGNGIDGVTNITGGVRHGAQNSVDLYGSEFEWEDTGNRILLADFDDPLGLLSSMGNSIPLNLEGSSAGGDSGGGVFVNIDGATYLIAVNAFTTPEILDGRYGTIMAATAVSPFVPWIQDNLASLGDMLLYTGDANGEFISTDSWLGDRISHVTPTSSDTVRFLDIGFPPVVSFSENAFTARAVMESGNTTFKLGGFTYTLVNSINGYSLEVGNQSDKSAQLIVRNGTFNTRGIGVGIAAGSSGGFHIEEGAAVLNSANDIVIGGSGLGVITQSSGSLMLPSGTTLYLGRDSGSLGSYLLTDGFITVDDLVVGSYGRGVFSMNGGTISVHGDLIIGQHNSEYNLYQQNSGAVTVSSVIISYYPGSNGAYELSGNGILIFNFSFTVGHAGSGTFLQSGGINSGNHLVVGFSGANGIYQMSETSQLTARDEQIGLLGTGRFKQNGGSNTVITDLFIGRYTGGNGTYELSGTGQLNVEKTIDIGDSGGLGAFYQNGGSVEAGELIIRSNSSYSLFNGTLQATFINLDSSGEGWIYQGGGTLSAEELHIGEHSNYDNLYRQTSGTSSVGSMMIGYYPGSRGAYELSGDGELSFDFSLTVGHAGSGTLLQSGGFVSGNHLVVGFSDSNGTYEISETGQLISRDEQIGLLGSGTFKQSGGSNTVITDLFIGRYSDGNGMYELSDNGHITVGETIDIGNSNGIGVFDQNEGNVEARDLIVRSSSAYILTGGTLKVDTIDQKGSFGFTGGTLHVNTFEGTLHNNGGVLAPGTSVGTTTVIGQYIHDHAAVLEIEIEGTNNGAYDTLNISGDLVLESMLVVQFLGAYVPEEGDIFNIIQFDGTRSGEFTECDLPTLDSALAWNIVYESDTIALNIISAYLEADFDLDRDVDIEDFRTWQNNYGSSAGGDADDDGDTDGNDFLIWQSQFGMSEIATSAIPEPAGLKIIFTMLLTCAFLLIQLKNK